MCQVHGRYMSGMAGELTNMTMCCRVWLYQGQVHIVPLPSAKGPTLPPSPTTSEALQIIRSEDLNTLARQGVQQAIGRRISGYPAKAEQDMHRARSMVPAAVAHVLQSDPQLVAPAVERFHYRDVDDMKAAARLRAFPPKVINSMSHLSSV